MREWNHTWLWWGFIPSFPTKGQPGCCLIFFFPQKMVISLDPSFFCFQLQRGAHFCKNAAWEATSFRSLGGLRWSSPWTWHVCESLQHLWLLPWKQFQCEMELFKHRRQRSSHLGGGFRYFLFSTIFGEMIQFDEHSFQMGWNHHL